MANQSATTAADCPWPAQWPRPRTVRIFGQSMSSPQPQPVQVRAPSASITSVRKLFLAMSSPCTDRDPDLSVATSGPSARTIRMQNLSVEYPKSRTVRVHIHSRAECKRAQKFISNRPRSLVTCATIWQTPAMPRVAGKNSLPNGSALGFEATLWSVVLHPQTYPSTPRMDNISKLEADPAATADRSCLRHNHQV